MIPNLTPSERAHWDKSMAHYARKHRPRKFTMRTVLLLSVLVVLLVGACATCMVVRRRPAPVWDSVLIDHSEIPQIDSL